MTRNDGNQYLAATRTVIDTGSMPGEVPTRDTQPKAAAPKLPAPEASTTLVSGTRVEQFEIIRKLGGGGMGQVYLARDTKLARLVALKFLGVQSAHFIKRFLDEALATAKCHHDNIIVIYDASEWQDQPYMVLEYLEGEPLSAFLRDRRMSPRRAVELMVPVVRALVRAHELDIVHRDLKPDNIFVTRTGAVKVLDFGIAKVFGAGQPAPTQDNALLASGTPPPASGGQPSMTETGAIVGTMPYMSPEQWGADTIDHRTDLWAVGIILWQMLTGCHPLHPVSPQRLQAMAAFLDEPMPRIELALPDIPAELARLINSCLVKPKEQRMASAKELQGALELLLPGRYARWLGGDECPYPGMTAFQENDASRFFGRASNIDHMLQRLRDQPLVGVLGPSGIGKSSFLRAGVIPALKASDESWEVLVTRPGRNPMASLAALVQPLTHADGSNVAASVAEHRALTERLWREPGLLGTVLRSRSRQKRGRLLLFVDQFEELYTLVGNAAERRAFAACLAGVADEPSTPLRVVVSMRSDLMSRVTEDPALMDRLTRGLLFLPAIDRAGMRAALVEPLDMVGYAFESEAMVEDMLAALDGTAGALPLLQFTAAKLWDTRDRERRLLTVSSYEVLGRVAGALATHADQLLAGLSPAQQRLTRSIFQRLVTSDGTRALADVDELEQLAEDSAEVRALLDRLVHGRLLSIGRGGEGEGSAVELVHESLINGWPTLRRWREENAEDSAFIEQLRAAAKQWEAKGRPAGLLWRGEAMDEAQRFHRRYRGELSPRERAYLEAVVAFAARSTRRRRQLVIGGFAFLSALVVAAVVALVWVRNAEQTAQAQKQLAETEAERARKAEADVREKLATIQAQKETIQVTQAEREVATQAAKSAKEQAQSAETKRKLTYEQLEVALAQAERERKRAESAQAQAEKAALQNKELASSERAAKEEAQRLAAEKEARINKLEFEMKNLAQTLH